MMQGILKALFTAWICISRPTTVSTLAQTITSPAVKSSAGREGLGVGIQDIAFQILLAQRYIHQRIACVEKYLQRCFYHGVSCTPQGKTSGWDIEINSAVIGAALIPDSRFRISVCGC